MANNPRIVGAGKGPRKKKPPKSGPRKPLPKPGPRKPGNGQEKGMPQRELQARKKQHLAMRDAALKKGNDYEATYKQYYKVIGQHGDKLTTADSDSLYRQADKAYVKSQSSYRSAKKWNEFYNKLGKYNG